MRSAENFLYHLKGENVPKSTETFTCAGSFLRTEGFLNEVLLNSQMSFACVPDCVFSSFGSTQSFVRHSGLDETLTEGGLDGGKFYLTDS